MCHFSGLRTPDRPERLLRAALAVCYHCHECQSATPREITLLVSGLCGLAQESRDMAVTQSVVHWLQGAEDLGEELARRSRPVLPSVARLCLVATFFEDALRLWFQWAEQLALLQDHHQCSTALAVAMVLLSLVGQLAGCALVLLHLYTNFAVTLLASLVLLQAHIYEVPLELHLLLRTISLLGGLLLLHVEDKEATACRIYRTSAGLPFLESRRSQHLMQLTGRVLLALMYLTLFQQYFTMAAMALNCFGLVLMAFIVMGYRTRLAALCLSLILTVWNVATNAWWSADEDTMDLLKYNYFHTLSVVGGLLLVVVLGPGNVSVEQYKKRW
ncbi:surfeit locus protein 4 homolog [Drosophila ficusphila]|uniref:surfeit locus protein 4 homolog n=1 Tax=Drosophila ficusphila TaxID=30025 RepID=UPI0007E6E9AC|nr:surfeit locus protein 4 homolog [Drosophila ficusphila]